MLFETVLVLGLFFGVFFWGHLSILRRWRERVENLQSERLPYDGVLSDRGGVRP